MSARVAVPILLVLVTLVFMPSFQAGFVDYDDPAFVTKNGYVNQGLNATGIQWAFTQQDLGRPLMHQGVGNVWHPLTWLSHMLDVQLFGLENPWGHHLHNVLLHLGSVVLLYFILTKLGLTSIGAVLVAGLFAVHPMRVESVAWISERKDVLSGLFFFGTILAYLHGRKWLSVVVFILALMSKPSVVVLPGLLVLLDWWKAGLPMESSLPKLRSLILTQVKEKLPWILPVVGVVCLTVWTQYSGTHGDFVSPLQHRLMMMPAGILFYLWRTVLPLNLSFHYPHPGNLWIMAAVPVLVLLLGALWRFRREVPQLVFGFLWFLLLWLPVSGIFQVGSSFTADRYTYLAHVGLFLGLFFIFQRRLVPVFSIVVIWAVMSFLQTGVWKNSRTLFAHGVEAQPRDSVALQNLASLYKIEKDFDQAIPLYQKSLALNPRDYIAHMNLGNCYLELKQPEKAQEAFQESLRAYPRYAQAHFVLGKLLSDSFGKHSEAEVHLRQAFELTSYREPEVAVALCQVLVKQGRASEAEGVLAKLPPKVRARIVRQ